VPVLIWGRGKRREREQARERVKERIEEIEYQVLLFNQRYVT
jgi:hypothetical protein